MPYGQARKGPGRFTPGGPPRLRFERYFRGRVYVMTGSLHAYGWPVEIAYEWAALTKALIFQRGC